MTQDEIIEMARQAGFRVGPSRDGPDDVWGVGANLHRFEALVRAKEREACAKLCEETNDGTPYNLTEECAAAIRARGQAHD